MNRIRFWNGNKSPSRQSYELELLRKILESTVDDLGAFELIDERTDYPLAEQEAGVFREQDFDVFATVAGNQKLSNEEKIVVHRCLMKGLLGYRILIVRRSDAPRFAAIETPDDLRSLVQGIPATWADAELFRKNGYVVSEQGSLDDQFVRLDRGEIDYVCFGANEVEALMQERASAFGNLTIEPSLVLYYPFPLVYYVHPRRDDLAFRIESGLERIVRSGTFDRLFRTTYAPCVESLRLTQRRTIELENPFLPFEMAGIPIVSLV